MDSESGNEFTIVRFGRSTINDLRKLTQIVFKYSPSYDDYIKLFGTKDEYLGLIAYHEGKPVAFFGAIEMLLDTGNFIEKAAQPVNIMVHPDYRNFDLFTMLYHRLFEIAKSENISIFFGWPNSELIFGKLLRWKKCCNMIIVRFKVKTVPYAKLLYKLSFTRKAMRRIIGFFVMPLKVQISDEVSKLFAQNDGFEILRNTQFLKQKASLGASIIKIKGKLVIISADYRIKLGDFQQMDLEEFEKVIKFLKILAFFCGMGEIVTILNPQSRISKSILDKYPGNESLSLMYKEINNNTVSSKLNLRFLDFDTF